MSSPTPDTTELREGVPIHDALLAVLPLVGVWRGDGVGIAPSSGDEFHYGQELRFAHDGRPFLACESRSWLVGADGEVIRQAWRESGFWRMGSGPDDIEVVLASNTGESLVFTGIAGDSRWDLTTSSVVPTSTAKHVEGEKRLYAITGSDLVYVTELAPAGRPFAPHLQAKLHRM